MRRRPLRCCSLITSLLLLAAFFVPFVEVGDLFDEVWDDDGQRLGPLVDRCQLQRRSAVPPESPDLSSPPGVFAVTACLPALEPRFQSIPGLLVFASPRPARPSWYPRYLERGPPARA